MGIPGLWPAIECTKRTVHIAKEFRGERVYVDGAVWLMKAVIANAREVLNGVYTTAVCYVVERTMWWVARGIIPTIGFDGKSLPGKERAHKIRQERRFKFLSQLAEETDLDAGKADNIMRKCVKPTEEFVVLVINALRERGVDICCTI